MKFVKGYEYRLQLSDIAEVECEMLILCLILKRIDGLFCNVPVHRVRN